MPLLNDKSRYLNLWGGAGSGKSYFAVQKMLTRILVGMSRDIKHKFICLRKTGPAARKSVFTLWNKYINEWGCNSVVKTNRSEMTYTFTGGSEVYCMGLDDPEKIKSIEGVTGAWLEEATEMTPDDFKQIDLRIRGKTQSYKQIVLSYNPISKLSWLHKEFHEQDKENTASLHTTYKDNRFLDAEYIRVLESLEAQDTTYHQIYTLGQWGILQNIIYTNWKRCSEWAFNVDDICYGLDFGFNHPTVLVSTEWRDDVPYITEQLYESGLTNNDLIEQLKKLIPDKKGVIYADHAEPARIEEISRAGFDIWPADKSVKDGIDCVKRFDLQIHPESTNIIDELQGYKWKEDKDGNVKDEPVKFRDDAMDAIRYAIYTYMKDRIAPLFQTIEI